MTQRHVKDQSRVMGLIRLPARCPRLSPQLVQIDPRLARTHSSADPRRGSPVRPQRYDATRVMVTMRGSVMSRIRDVAVSRDAPWPTSMMSHQVQICDGRGQAASQMLEPAPHFSSSGVRRLQPILNTLVNPSVANVTDN